MVVDYILNSELRESSLWRERETERLDMYIYETDLSCLPVHWAFLSCELVAAVVMMLSSDNKRSG